MRVPCPKAPPPLWAGTAGDRSNLSLPFFHERARMRGQQFVSAATSSPRSAASSPAWALPRSPFLGEPMTTLRNITDALATCQLPLPKSAARWTTISDALRAHHDAQLVEDLTNALEAMTADSAGETVDRLTRQRLEVEPAQIVARQLIEGANARAVRAVQADADSIIAAARKQFDQAAKTIADNATVYSASDTHEDLLRRGVHAAEVWSKIAHASQTLDAVTHLWSTLYGTPATLDAVVSTYDGDHWRRMDGEALFARATAGTRSWPPATCCGSTPTPRPWPLSLPRPSAHCVPRSLGVTASSSWTRCAHDARRGGRCPRDVSAQGTAGEGSRGRDGFKGSVETTTEVDLTPAQQLPALP